MVKSVDTLHLDCGDDYIVVRVRAPIGAIRAFMARASSTYFRFSKKSVCGGGTRVMRRRLIAAKSDAGPNDNGAAGFGRSVEDC